MVVLHRDVHAYRRTEPGTAVDGQRATERVQAVRQAGQPQPAGPVKIETAPVVADRQAEPAVLLAQRHLDLGGPGVLDHVRQGLGQHVPGGHLDLLAEAHAAQPWVGPDHHRQGQPAGLRLDGLEQPAVGQHRRMDRVGDLPDVVQRGGQIALHVGQPVGGGRVAAQQLLPDQPGPGRQRHDLLLNPVVQNPLNPPAFSILARDDPVAGGRQFGRLVPDLLDAPGQCRGEVEIMHAHRGLGGEVGQQPAILGEQRTVGTRAALDASQDGAADTRWARPRTARRPACRP